MLMMSDIWTMIIFVSVEFTVFFCITILGLCEIDFGLLLNKSSLSLSDEIQEWFGEFQIPSIQQDKKSSQQDLS